MTNIKTWPVQFSEFATGKPVATEWFRSASPDMYEEITKRAEFWARFTGTEIDCAEGSVMPSGAIGSWSRMGMRARPA